MRYRMLALDLDGTLLDSSGRVSDANLAAVTRAKAAGVMVVLCTGRGLHESRTAIERLDHHGPIILANGAMVADPTVGKTLHRMVMEPHLALGVANLLDEGGDAPLVLVDPEPTGLDYVVTRPERITENTRWWFETIGARVRTVETMTEQDVHHALRVGIVGPGSRMDTVIGRVKQKFGDRVFTQYFTAVQRPDDDDVNVLEVFVAGVNKWAGLRWLAREHGIDESAVAAIGDQINDVQMIEAAGCGVAMANAVPEVVQVADQTTRHHDEDGVAAAIEAMLCGRW